MRNGNSQHDASTTPGWNMDGVMVSAVKGAKATATKDYAFSKALEAIRQGQYTARVQQIRETYRQHLASGDLKQAKEAIKPLKEGLPGIMFSGTFTARRASALRQHSGVLCCDLDTLGDRLVDLRAALECDEYVIASFVSPSGDGLKVLLRVEPEGALHKASFAAAEKHFSKKYGVTIDPSGSDVSRLCFVSADADLKVNPNAITLPPFVDTTVVAPPVRTDKSSSPKPSTSTRNGRSEKGERDILQNAPFFADLLGAALITIPADDYDTWIKVGMALHSWNDEEEFGLDIWNTWSQSSPKYVEGECAEKWSSFAIERKDKINVGTIFYLARQNGWDRDANYVKSLATLQRLERDRWIGVCADRLGVSPKSLCEEVVKVQREAAMQARATLAPIEPWPEPVDGVMLLNALVANARRFVFLPAWAAESIALWIVHTFAFLLRDFTPRLQVRSPMKRCGKSSLLYFLHKLVNRPILASDMTASVMFRLIHREPPTLLFDEWDSAARGDKGEALRNVLNSGFHKLGTTWRTVGDDFEPMQFSTFAPIVVAAIGDLPDTVVDRSITIEMQRKLPGERLERSRKFDGIELKRKCLRWVNDNAQALAEAEPQIPDRLNDRQADCWEPLFAIADVVGGEWPEQARASALALSGRSEAEALPQTLLADVRSVFDNDDDDEPDKIKTDTLLKRLNAMEDRPWPTICNGREMTAHKLSKMLRSFSIAPGSVRFTRSTAKGYTRDQFIEAWERYLPPAAPANMSATDTRKAPLDENDD